MTQQDYTSGREWRENPVRHTPVARVALLDGSISGLREIDSLGSILTVRAAPFSQLDQIKANCDQFSYIAYIIDGPRIYTGHGWRTRNIGDRVDEEANRTSQVCVICSRDPRFEKFAASYVEARLIDIADELGLPIANIVRPYGRGRLRVSTDLEPLVQDAQFLLSIAGFGVSNRLGGRSPIDPCAWP